MRSESIAFTLMVLMAVVGSGCYSPTAFRSDSADVLASDFWSSPRYRLVFEDLNVRQSKSVTFSFTNPPRCDMIVGFNFPNVDDLEALARHGGNAEIIIRRASGQPVFTASVVFALPETGRSPVGFAAVRPPLSWSPGAGSCVVDMSHAPDSTKPSDEWTFASAGHVVEAGRLPLGSGAYTMEIRVQVDAVLDKPVHVYPILAGDFKSVL